MYAFRFGSNPSGGEIVTSISPDNVASPLSMFNPVKKSQPAGNSNGISLASMRVTSTEVAASKVPGAMPNWIPSPTTMPPSSSTEAGPAGGTVEITKLLVWLYPSRIIVICTTPSLRPTINPSASTVAMLGSEETYTAPSFAPETFSTTPPVPGILITDCRLCPTASV